MQRRPNSPRGLADGEHIDAECRFLPPPQSVIDPRLIVMLSDGEAVEFMNERQLEYHF